MLYTYSACYLCISVGDFDVPGCRENFSPYEVDIVHCNTQCLVRTMHLIVWYFARLSNEKTFPVCLQHVLNRGSWWLLDAYRGPFTLHTLNQNTSGGRSQKSKRHFKLSAA